MFTKTLKTLRKSSKLSQEEIAKKLDITRTTYSHLETGNSSPTLEQIEKLSSIFDVNPETFINGIADNGENYDMDIDLKDYTLNILPREILNENIEKFREVLLYLLDQVSGKANFGETVLYKLLYFIDFDYYEKTGKSITGLTYVRNHYGPTPKLKTFGSVVKMMSKRGELDVVETPGFNSNQKKYLPRIAPRLDELNASELDHINEVISRLGDKNAKELTALSHKDTPWLATKHMKPIDYQLAKYRTSETSVKELEDEL